MFGLLKAKKCGQTSEEKRRRRLHYCGTCKTMGSLYGEKTRFLLNHDTVFLAELLSAISPENKNPDDWNASFQSYNCLNLPKTSDEIPLSLGFAATANVVLAEFKFQDQINDTNKLKWKLARRFFSKSFGKAKQKLETAHFPLEKLFSTLKQQETRENAAIANEIAPDAVLDFLAEPTAVATALFFENGVKTVRREDLADSFYALGENFGKLVYLLDAFEDYEKDFKRGEFNALRKAFRLTEKTLSASVRRQTVGKLRALQLAVSLQIHNLPISDELQKVFVERFETNLSRKIQTKLPILSGAKTCGLPKAKTSLADKLKNAESTAKKLTARGFSAKTWRENPQIPVVFAFVAIFAFIAPSYAKQAESWQECAGLSLNLMFLGTIFGSAITSFGSTVKPVKSYFSENLREEVKEEFRKTARGEKNKNCWCDCCSDCACEGCCDSCECCGCGDGCDCSCN